MRALFYHGEPRWNGSARALLAGARGLAGRGHDVAFACCADSRIERAARAAGLAVVTTEPDAGAAGSAWALRRVLRERSVEVAYTHGDRGQLVVSSAMRFAERGAVIRRVPSFQRLVVQRSGRVALKMTTAGLLFSTERELREANAPEFPLAAAVAPLGVDATAYDAVTPATRKAIGAPSTGLLLVCSYDPSARFAAANVFRTLAALALRHRDIHLAVVGPGSTDADLRMHAAALGVGPLVSFLGEREDALAILRAADIGWVVAHHDDGAYACLDFMAMRIPVLAERGALPQHYVADGIAGILLSPSDPAVTAASVSAFIAHADRRAAMGSAGRARVQREFTETALVDGFERAGAAAADRTQWAAR